MTRRRRILATFGDVFVPRGQTFTDKRLAPSLTDERQNLVGCDRNQKPRCNQHTDQGAKRPSQCYEDQLVHVRLPRDAKDDAGRDSVAEQEEDDLKDRHHSWYTVTSCQQLHVTFRLARLRWQTQTH